MYIVQNMTVNVCYVLNTVSQTNAVTTIAAALTEYEDVNVDLLAWFETGPFDGENHVDIECFEAPRSKLGINIKIYREVCRYFKKYDIVQTHMNHSGMFAKLIGYRLNIPLVSREGNTREGFSRQGHVANGLTNALADRIVPNSRAVYDSFVSWEQLLINDDDVEIIPNGVDLDRIDTARDGDYNLRQQFAIPEDAAVVGTVSVISEQKGYDTLISALAAANDQSDRRLDLVIVGDGPRRSRIEARTKTLGVRKYVHFAGFVDRDTVYRILAEIDFYTMPSRWEGFASAAVEALAAGNACVFSDIDPFVIPYRNVALFHRLDDVHDLADKLTKLAENPEQREPYANKGRQLIEQQYTIEQVAEQYADLYKDILSER